MSSFVAEPGAVAGAPQVCPHCRKEFPRLCDLNKHTKSHSRPFKCEDMGCKYHEHGWPTAKELERHVNDKHSVAPRTFACAFPPCTYESKRESNCKQHMEKKHGWKYQRSKSNGKRVTRQPSTAQSRIGPIALQTSIPSNGKDMGTSPQSVSESFKPYSENNFGNDFVLFPLDDSDQPNIVGQAGERLRCGYEHAEEADSRVFIPWTSPATRLLKNQSVLDRFTETYNRPPGKGLGPPDALIDPSLQQYGQPPGPSYQRLDVNRLSPMSSPIKAEPPGLTMDRHSWHGGSEAGSALADSPTDSRRNPSTAYSSQFHTPHSAGLDFTGSPTQSGQMGWNQQNLRRRGSDEDNHRPEKKLKSGAGDEFTDTNMPDIFRFAHPSIYDRDQKEKYSPCHSSHRDISTLVRHLGRPAHRLLVTKEAISSFDIEDAEYPHPRVGVCRRCWRQFYQRDAFEEHTTSTCDKVSKGKREKWQVLYDSFTPLVDPSTNLDNTQTLHSPRGEELQDELELGRSPSRQSGFFISGVYGTSWDEPISPTSAAPVPSFMAPSETPVASIPECGSISLQEYERLQQEHNALRQQFEKMANALLVSRTYQNPTGFGSVAQGPRPSPLVPMAGSSVPAGPSQMQPLFPRSASSDRDNLLQHMGTHPLDFDIDPLMNESHETLSRQNSGVSSTPRSSHSTVHHVTNSPPLPTEDFDPADDHGTGKPRAAKPPTSDSGYISITNQRHGSFGDITSMPGGSGFLGNHHRNSSSMSTLRHHDENESKMQWPSNNAASGAGQPNQQHQQQNTFMAEPAQPQPASEPSFDDGYAALSEYGYWLE